MVAVVVVVPPRELLEFVLVVVLSPVLAEGRVSVLFLLLLFLVYQLVYCSIVGVIILVTAVIDSIDFVMMLPTSAACGLLLKFVVLLAVL